MRTAPRARRSSDLMDYLSALSRIAFPRSALLVPFAALLVALLPALAAAQNFGGAFDGMRDSDEPVQIEADRLEVVDGEGVAVFEGNVNVVQGTTVLKTSRLKAYYARDARGNAGPGGNLRRIEATGKVAVRSDDQVATADKAVVDMKTQIVTLSGNVAVSQGQNIITGCQIVLDMETNNISVTPCKGGGGRVSVQIDTVPQN